MMRFFNEGRASTVGSWRTGSTCGGVGACGDDGLLQETFNGEGVVSTGGVLVACGDRGLLHAILRTLLGEGERSWSVAVSE